MSRVSQLTRFLAHACAAVILLSALAAAQSSTPTFPGTSTVVPSTGDINSTLAKFNPFAPTADLTVSSVIGAVINIVIGILFVFFGIRLFKTVLFLGGALFGGYLAFAILTNAEPDGGYKVAISREAFYLIIILVAGLVCGFLALFLWRVGLVLLGAVGGFVLAVFLQGSYSQPNGILDHGCRLCYRRRYCGPLPREPSHYYQHCNFRVVLAVHRNRRVRQDWVRRSYFGLHQQWCQQLRLQPRLEAHSYDRRVRCCGAHWWPCPMVHS
ncbi:hypothetical protein M427DRAFT_181860 [Gonapodya prolifera JEL478]|uniref:Transmembrane protein 198 n=1 Tax=Gonapodya prolifera (strain JEL478) TaxID=1344416 RepID=A0A139AQN5_GONPJ|nr:hypothetical protein M427DRAFT_181860 [Gonapodya prolifera JEL478]|eukprot:KXS19049.1 hypothetical protein M427DRAFT_181860 [Gonapodya prolifera JEL478]